MHIFLRSFLCILILLQARLVYANEWYFKIDAPLYTGLSKLDTRSSDTYDKLVSTRAKFKSNYRLAVGYQLSNYFDAEMSLGSHSYSFEEIGEIAQEYNMPISIVHDKFAFAYNNYGKPYCCRIPGTFLSKDEICSDDMSHKLFAFAYDNYRYNQPYCSSIPSTLLTKKQICVGEAYSLIQPASTQVSSKLYTVLPLLRFKPFKDTENRFTPYVSASVGLAHARSRIIKSFFSENHIQIQTFKKTTNALALELGIGANIKLAKKISLDVEAKYFNYGKHKFIASNPTQIEGYTISSGLRISL